MIELPASSLVTSLLLVPDLCFPSSSVPSESNIFFVIFATGRAVLQSAILTAVAVIGLTLFTFWAANMGHDFTFMFPFLFVSLLVLLVYLLIQMMVPLGTVGTTIYGALATVIFSAFIIYDTNMLVKHHTYNDYVVAAISLYLDVINLFMAQLFCAIQ